jgi:hypothetical protein
VRGAGADEVKADFENHELEKHGEETRGSLGYRGFTRVFESVTRVLCLGENKGMISKQRKQ